MNIRTRGVQARWRIAEMREMASVKFDKPKGAFAYQNLIL
jgi:hypothetical protein